MDPETPQNCAVQRTLAVLGDRWSLGILRSIFYGHRRYNEIQRDLGIATNVLADRLRSLVEHGILERVPYQEHPLRHEYVPTPKGSELAATILALREWGRRNLEWDEPPPPLEHVGCGGTIEVTVVCEGCGDTVVPTEITRAREVAVP